MNSAANDGEAISVDECDVVVIGAGIVGLCVSVLLADEGADVSCLDAGNPAGSTANAGSLHVQMQSRLMRLFPERIPDYLETLPIYPRAVDAWKGMADELLDELGEDIDLSIGGGLMVAESEAHFEELRTKTEQEQRLGIDTELVDRQALRELAPYLADAVHGAALCHQEGKLNPLAANEAIRRRALARNVAIRAGETVERIEPGAGHILLHCNSGRTWRAAQVVIAAGAGTGRLTEPLGCEVPVMAEPLHMNVTEPLAPLLGHLLQHAELPITLKQFRNGQLVVGGGWPAELREPSGHPSVLLSSLRGNLGLAARLVPALRSLRVIRSWAGINPTVDLLSVIGELPGCPGVYVAVPGDAGYTLGPYCARLLVDSMQGRTPDFPLSKFAPGRRSAVMAGATPLP